MESDYETIVSDCTRALLSVGAVRSPGTQAQLMPPVGGSLEGGIHGWPTRRDGEQIRISISREGDPSLYRISVVSYISFRPRLRRRKHDENLGRGPEVPLATSDGGTSSP